MQSSVFLLSLFRADFDDSATYSAVATNVHGQASTNCAVVVRSKSYFMIKTTHKYNAHVIKCLLYVYLVGYREGEEPHPAGIMPFHCKYCFGFP